MAEASEAPEVARPTSAPSAWIALLRIFVGVYFLSVGLPKLRDIAGFSRQLEEILPKFSATPHEWYGAWLGSTAIPHTQTFGYLVAVGEVAVGALLILGLVTGLASLIGAFMTANYFFATAGLGAASTGVNLYATVVFILLIATQAGRKWGLDCLLAREVPRMKILW